MVLVYYWELSQEVPVKHIIRSITFFSAMESKTQTIFTNTYEGIPKKRPRRRNPLLLSSFLRRNVDWCESYEIHFEIGHHVGSGTEMTEAGHKN
jgi:hypothetical protein